MPSKFSLLAADVIAAVVINALAAEAGELTLEYSLELIARLSSYDSSSDKVLNLATLETIRSVQPLVFLGLRLSKTSRFSPKANNFFFKSSWTLATC